MKNIRTVIYAMVVFAALPGCALLGDVSDRAAQQIARGVIVYCEETIVDVRETFRTKVNQYAAPHSVAVECADGMELTTEHD